MDGQDELRDKLKRAWEGYQYFKMENSRWYSTFSSANMYPHRVNEAQQADKKWREYQKLQTQTEKYINLLLSETPPAKTSAPYRRCDLCGVENPTRTWGDCKVCELHYDMLSSGWFTLTDF